MCSNRFSLSVTFCTVAHFSPAFVILQIFDCAAYYLGTLVLNLHKGIGRTITICLLLLLTLPVSVVTESRERAIAKRCCVGVASPKRGAQIAQTQIGNEQRQQKLELQELLRLSQLGVEQYNKTRFLPSLLL